MSSHRPLQKRHVRGTSLGFLLEWFLSITHTKPVFYHNIQYTLRRRKTFPGELGLGLCPLVEGSLHPTPPWAEMELCVPAGHGGLKQASKVGGCPDATPPGRNAASVPGVGGPPGGQGPKWSTQPDGSGPCHGAFLRGTLFALSRSPGGSVCPARCTKKQPWEQSLVPNAVLWTQSPVRSAPSHRGLGHLSPPKRAVLPACGHARSRAFLKGCRASLSLHEPPCIYPRRRISLLFIFFAVPQPQLRKLGQVGPSTQNPPPRLDKCYFSP